MAMASPSSRRAACRSSVWAMLPCWAACSDATTRFIWPWRATMRRVSSFIGLRAGRRGGVAIARTAPVDGSPLTGRSGARTKKRMTDQKETTKPTKPLTLSTTARSGSAAAKGGGETQVRQKFSHGRTRAVTVEVKKTAKRPGAPAPAAAAPAPTPAPAPSAPAPAAPGRTLKLGGASAPAPTPARASTPPAAPSGARSTLSPRPAGQAGRGGAVLKTLTEEEKEARARALVDANRDAEVARQRAAEDAKRRDAEDKARHAAEEEHRRRLADEEARKKADEEMKRKADALVQKRMDQAAAAPQTPMARQVEEIGVRPPATPPSAPPQQSRPS